MKREVSLTEIEEVAASGFWQACLKIMRPKQWTKNLVIFAGIIFSGNFFRPGLLITTCMAFAGFCLLSSGVYVLNDIIDREKDANHPQKRCRPIPSGQLRVGQAVGLAILLLLLAFGLAVNLGLPFTAVAAGYVCLVLAYSFYFKHVVILDVLVLALGFVLRAIAGAVVINVYISPWLLLCTILLAMFLGFNKRRHELLLLEGKAVEHRKILEEYTPAMLDQMIAIVTAATIMAYGLYTFSAGHTPLLMLTIPFVFYGIFRYMYLVHQKNMGGSPEMVLLTDLPMVVNILLWVTIVMLALYW